MLAALAGDALVELQAWTRETDGVGPGEAGDADDAMPSALLRASRRARLEQGVGMAAAQLGSGTAEALRVLRQAAQAEGRSVYDVAGRRRGR